MAIGPVPITPDAASSCPAPPTPYTSEPLLTLHSSVIPGGQQSAAALKYLSQGTNDHQYTWKIDIESGAFSVPSVG